MLADPDTEIIGEGGGGGGRENLKKNSALGASSIVIVPLSPSLDPPLHTTNKQCESIVPP